jgi:hypothetical protein
VVRCHVPDDPVGLSVQVQFRLVLGRPFLLRDVVLRDVDQLTVNREVPRGHQHLADLGSPARHRRGLTRQEEEGEEDEEGLRGSAVQHAHPCRRHLWALADRKKIFSFDVDRRRRT